MKLVGPSKKAQNSFEYASENTSNRRFTLSSVHKNILHSWDLGKKRNVPCIMSQSRGIRQIFQESSKNSL